MVFAKCVILWKAEWKDIILFFAGCMTYPICDENALVKDEYELAVQVNSRMKAKIIVPSDADNKQIEDIALKNEAIAAATEGLQIVKVIVIPKRLVNIVCK